MKPNLSKIHDDDLLFSAHGESKEDIPLLPGPLGKYTARDMMDARRYPDISRYLERKFFAPARENYKEIKAMDMEELVSRSFGSPLGRLNGLPDRRGLREELVDDFVRLVNERIRRERQEREEAKNPRARMRVRGQPPAKPFNSRQ